MAFSNTHLEALEASRQLSKAVTYSFGNKRPLVSKIGTMGLLGPLSAMKMVFGSVGRRPWAMDS